MLDFFRTSSKSWVVRIFLLLLAASFGLFWGINDVFQEFINPKGLAKIGSTHISAKEFNQALGREIERLEQSYGQKIDEEMLYKTGVFSHTLQRLVHERLLENEADRIGLVVPDEVIRETVHQIPAFHTNKKFDHQRLVAILKRQNMTEVQFVDNLRRDIQRNMLAQLVLSVVNVPDSMSQAYKIAYFERRNVKVIKIPYEAQIISAQPLESDLERIIAKYRHLFTIPEFREGVLYEINRNDIKVDKKWSEEDFKYVYNSSRQSFITPEKRHIQKLLIPLSIKDKVLALKDQHTSLEKIKDAIQAGVLEKPEWILKNTLDNDDAKKIFNAEKGQIVELSEQDNFIALAQVQEIQASIALDFADAREQIIKKLTQDEQQKLLEERLHAIEEDIENNLKPEILAAKHQVSFVPFKMNIKGRDVQGKTINSIPEQALKACFNTDVNSLSTSFKYENHKVGLVYVKAIQPEHQLGLNEAREQAQKIWLSEQQQQKAFNLAEDIQKFAKKNKGWHQIMRESNLKDYVVKDMTRPELLEKNSAVPPVLAHAAFSHNIGQFGIAEDKDACYVITVLEKNSSHKLTLEENKLFRKALAQHLQEDIMKQYFHALEENFPVKIHTDFKKSTKPKKD